ncbi:nucleoside hydrolase [Mycoplasmatota bacterium]|nr:nucleoside hydrolase [Mycoplasmatota bacterium]
MEKRKIIIDTDPGIDDAFAITAASKYSNFEILGVTSVAGNKGLEVTTQNALKLVKLNNIDCMVYKGASDSLLEQELPKSDNAGAHGVDGLGGVQLDYDEEKLSNKHAVDFILETVKKYPNEIEIFTLGPVTNIALAIQKDIETMKLVKSIWSMGGGVVTGNMNPVAEFNYWFDAKAVEIMYSIGEYVDIHMIGLNVTQPSYLSANDILFMKLEGGQLGEILYNMQQSVLPVSGWEEERIIGNIIHDLLTVIYAIDSSVCPNVLRTNLQVSTEDFTVGQTVVDQIRTRQYGPDNAFVAMSVDSRKYKELFMEIVFGKETGLLYKNHVIS